MKRILLIITAAVIALVAPVAMVAKGEKKGTPTIVFETMTHDFGNIREDGGPKKCEFIFTNTGNAPLVIISATASCGCTRPQFPKEPIKPGKSGKITVTFLPLGHPGEIYKDVKVRTNAPDNKRIKLKLRGAVIPSKSKR